jgi:GNAT superfamily N-acetyltransferase
MLARLIEVWDTPTIVRLAEAMHAEAPTYRDLAFDPAKVEALCRLCLDSDDWICVVAVNDDQEVIGFTAAGVVPTLFGPDALVEDLAFYVDPAWRGTTAAVRMLRMLETWASVVGAKAVRMGITTGTNPVQTARFLSRFGYAETGWLYTKPLGPLS